MADRPFNVPFLCTGLVRPFRECRDFSNDQVDGSASRSGGVIWAAGISAFVSTLPL